MKIACQRKKVSRMPPTSGPSVGAATITVATRPSTEAARSRSNRSRMIARATTMPAEAPIACRMRATMMLSTVGMTIAIRLANTVSARPPSITGRRPKRSDSGPITSCATASPIRNSDTVSCMVVAGVPNWCDSSGTAGTRMLSEVGPIAVVAIRSSSRPHGVFSRSRSRVAAVVSFTECLRPGRTAGSRRRARAAFRGRPAAPAPPPPWRGRFRARRSHRR